MGQDCLFCRITSGALSSEVVYRDAYVTAFRDIQPQAPTHVLVVPNEHIVALDDVTDVALAGRIVMACARVASAEGLDQGYRVVANVGRDGGQSVGHLHFHLLGGRPMRWPPG